jgi:hypothetical protein
MMADVPPALEKEETEDEDTGIDRAEFTPGKALDRSFAPIISWPIVSWPIISRLKLASPRLSASRPAGSRPQRSRIVISSFAAASGALSLCVYFFVAFHRIGTVPGSQAHNSPPQLSSPDTPSAPEPTPVAENPAPMSDVPPQDGDGPNAAVDPVSPELPSSITTTHPMTTPERASRRPAAHVASRSSGGPHVPGFSRVPASTSNRRMTLALASPRATRSAQSYFDLAHQEMHRGNYAAAAANYKLAWRIEDKNAAARGHLLRARRTMQPQNESIANR